MADTANSAPATSTAPSRASAVRANVALLLDQVVATINAGSYPDGIPADLDAMSKTATYRAKTLRAVPIA